LSTLLVKSGEKLFKGNPLVVKDGVVVLSSEKRRKLVRNGIFFLNRANRTKLIEILIVNVTSYFNMIITNVTNSRFVDFKRSDKKVKVTIRAKVRHVTFSIKITRKVKLVTSHFVANEDRNTIRLTARLVYHALFRVKIIKAKVPF